MLTFEFWVLYYSNYTVMNIPGHKAFSLLGVISWWQVPNKNYYVSKTIMSISKIFDTFWKSCFIFASFEKIIFSIKKRNNDLKNGINIFMEFWGRIFWNWNCSKKSISSDCHIHRQYIMAALWRKISEGSRRY